LRQSHEDTEPQVNKIILVQYLGQQAEQIHSRKKINRMLLPDKNRTKYYGYNQYMKESRLTD